MYLLKRLSFLLAVVAFFSSCRKGELPEEHYFGKVGVTLLNLPNTPRIMMYFDGKQLDTITALGDGSYFFLPAGKPGKLSAYDANKQELLADTLIDIVANGVQKFKFAYSPDLGLKGFIGGSSGGSVPVDSFDIQFFNKLSPSFYPLEKYDLVFFLSDPDTDEFTEYPVRLKGFERGKLSNVVRIRALNDNKNEYSFVAKLIDPATGKAVLQPNKRDRFPFVSENPGGKTKICTLSNNTNGSITNNSIDL